MFNITKDYGNSLYLYNNKKNNRFFNLLKIQYAQIDNVK